MKKDSFLKSVFIVLFALAFFGCQKQGQEGVVITVPEDRSSVISLSDIGRKMDVLKLQYDLSSPIAPVLDISVCDKCVYVLDAMGTLSAFSLENGQIEHQLSAVGHGRGEYIHATAVCAADDSVYVLDFQCVKVIVYDDNLMFVRQFALDFPAIDFAKVEDGFLFYNMNADKNRGQIVYTTMSGKHISDFLSPEYVIDMMLSQNVFSESEDGIYINPPLSKQIYHWNGTQPDLAYTVDFGHVERKPDESSEIYEKSQEKVMYSIVSKDAVLTFYLYEGRALGNQYVRKSKQSVSGLFSTSSPYPFLPTVQYDGKLYAVVNPLDCGLSDSEDQLHLLVFTRDESGNHFKTGS